MKLTNIAGETIFTYDSADLSDIDLNDMYLSYTILPKLKPEEILTKEIHNNFDRILNCLSM